MIKKILIPLFVIALVVFVLQKPAQKPPLSYRVILITQDIIKQNKPAPTTAALQYAYIALAYDTGLKIAGQSGALFTSKEILMHIFPESTQKIQTEIERAQVEYKVKTHQNKELDNLVTTLKERFNTDGHLAIWTGTPPKGDGLWYQTTDVPPFTPLAGQWKRWNVTEEIQVPKPPTFGSKEDMEQIQIVKNAAQNRNGTDVQKINFWGGVPGTETPAGIWLNQLYKTIQHDLPSNNLDADILYSRTQSILAQTISDAFMECWKVKYTYWTARPNMRDQSIVTSMPNPNFPSYVSGHSTISKAAADVLGVIAPKYKELWLDMAKEARDSRLSAGIHFEVDNMVGFDVGTEVAKQTIKSLGL